MAPVLVNVNSRSTLPARAKKALDAAVLALAAVAASAAVALRVVLADSATATAVADHADIRSKKEEWSNRNVRSCSWYSKVV